MVSGLFALLDDIAAIIDDVAVMSKIAGKKRQVFWAMIWSLMLKKPLDLFLNRNSPFYWLSQKVSSSIK